MRKRAFLQTLAALAAGGVRAALAAEARPTPTECPPDARPVGKRRRPNRNGVWIPAAKTRTTDQWKAAFDRMRVAGVDGVLIQAWDGQHAYWDTTKLPVKQDRVSSLTALAKAAGLEAHAWMATLPCREEGLRTKYRDWFVGSSEILDPAQPAVREHLAGLVGELAAVGDVVGVHVDELHYPEGVLSKETAFAQREALTALVNDHLVPAAHRRQRSLTAAVLPDLGVARDVFGQDWPRWTLNAFFPQLYQNLYNANLDWIQARAREAAAAVGVPVCAGLDVASLSFPDLAKAVRGALDSGASGVSLFSLDSMTEEKWMGLQIVVVGQRPD
jgi:uncharacterized lipoprotein YddW (UPF0748 family)